MTILLLAGCSLFSANSLTARSGAPFSFEGVKSALFVLDASNRPEDGYAGGYLVLSSEELGCPAFTRDLVEHHTADSDILWEGSGMLAQLAWYALPARDAGWEGTYESGNYGQYFGYYSYYYTNDPVELRMWEPLVWGDGELWSTYGSLGLLEITDYGQDEVVGKGSTEWLKFKFKAEHCGELETVDPPDDDTGPTSYDR